MAFTYQTTVNLADLISKLNTFLLAQGWSTHHVPASGEFAAWKNPGGGVRWITLATQWDTGTPDVLGIYQWHGLAYNALSSPWAQNLDSGNGAASTARANLLLERRVFTTTTPECFWCYEDDNYFHVIVRRSTDVYEHFGAGELVKYNDWTGGEYCYGHLFAGTVNAGCALQGNSSHLLDGIAVDMVAPYDNMELRVATLHIEGMAEQGVNDIWGVVMGNQNAANLGVDRAANARIHINGGFRGGLFPPLFGQFAGTLQRGLVPLYPIVPVYWNRTTGHVYGPLGMMPDVRGVQIKNYASEQEIVVGADTWVVFPSYRRRDIPAATAGYSERQGIAYKQVV